MQTNQSQFVAENRCAYFWGAALRSSINHQSFICPFLQIDYTKYHRLKIILGQELSANPLGLYEESP